MSQLEQQGGPIVEMPHGTSGDLDSHDKYRHRYLESVGVNSKFR